MSLTDDDLRKIWELIDERLDKKLGEKLDEKLDQRFGKNNEILADQITEQVTERVTKQVTEQVMKKVTSFMLEHFPTREEVDMMIDTKIDRLRTELLKSIAGVQGAIVNFEQLWNLSRPSW